MAAVKRRRYPTCPISANRRLFSYISAPLAIPLPNQIANVNYMIYKRNYSSFWRKSRNLSRLENRESALSAETFQRVWAERYKFDRFLVLPK